MEVAGGKLVRLPELGSRLVVGDEGSVRPFLLSEINPTQIFRRIFYLQPQRRTACKQHGGLYGVSNRTAQEAKTKSLEFDIASTLLRGLH